LLQKISEELRVIEGYVINFSLRLGFTFDLPQKLGIIASYELAFGLIFTLQRITFDFTQTTQNPKKSRLESGNARLVLSNAKPNRGDNNGPNAVFTKHVFGLAAKKIEFERIEFDRIDFS
jgi:hypothetical protein